MFFWLTTFDEFWKAHPQWGKFVNVFQYQTFRMSMAVVTAFMLMMIISPFMVRLLQRAKVGSSVDFHHAKVNELYSSKKNVPTMGGLIILMSIIGTLVLWGNLGNFYIFLGILTLIWLGALGFADDYLKMIVGNRKGLRSWEKLVFQMGLAVILGAFIWNFGRNGIIMPDSIEFWQTGEAMPLTLPLWKYPIPLGIAGFMLVSVLVIGGTSNAVNLADGMDGLATGSAALVAAALMLISYIAGREAWSNYLFFPYVEDSGELAVYCAAILGATLGFLWFNCHPARVFMGDTGSLPLGGAMGLVAMVTRQEFLLFIIGGVFVMEAASVMMQVSFFKLTGGKRIFLMTPIHHHFQLKGWTETQTVVRFWLIGAICAAVALATLKLR